MHEGEMSALLGLAGIPSTSESTAIARDAAIARYEGGRIHVQHVSARESVEAVELAKGQGVRVTAEVTPHHLCLTDDAVRSLDANFKMNPPLRSEEDRRALIDALRSGTLDSVGTDHAPHAREEKEQPFEVAPMGVTGLETAFAALHTRLVLPGLIDLPTLVMRMTAGGDSFGITAPSLAPGSEANVCLVDPEAEWEVGEALEKVCFSAARAEDFHIEGREQVLLCGIESHVCVSQTAHDLVDRGLEVHVARDAVSSRSEENRELGIHKMEQAGAVVTSVETALFELVGAAGTPEFERVQELIR